MMGSMFGKNENMYELKEEKWTQDSYFRQFMDHIRDVPSELTCESEKVEKVG